MRLTIQLRGIPAAETLRSHIERRLGFGLARLEDRLTSIVVRCSDVNGPKGGRDKRCRIELRGPAFGTVVVAALADDWTMAVDQAVGQASRALVRALERVARWPAARLATATPEAGR